VGHVPEEIVAKALADTPEGFSLTFTPEEDSDEKRRELVAGADYLICYGRGFDDFDVANKAKIFQVLSAGYDRLDIGAFTKIGIPVANNGGANAPTVAEHAIMLMLAVYKKLPTHHYALHNGEWLGHRHALVMRELRGKQVGVVGFGNIGQQVARIANGFLANVAFFDPLEVAQSVKDELNAKQLGFDDLLATSDVITVHTPLNDATRAMMNKAAFSKMKSTAIFVSTARGPVTDEAALIDALDKGVIAGAGIDVFEEEPTPNDNALFGRDNVVVTPHMAGTTIDTWYRRLDFAFSNIQRVANGEAPLAQIKE
jgi:D-3-phosphoglycerate dehydrogenase